jgi:hypothetical protein
MVAPIGNPAKNERRNRNDLHESVVRRVAARTTTSDGRRDHAQRDGGYPRQRTTISQALTVSAATYKLTEGLSEVNLDKTMPILQGQLKVSVVKANHVQKEFAAAVIREAFEDMAHEAQLCAR